MAAAPHVESLVASFPTGAIAHGTFDSARRAGVASDTLHGVTDDAPPLRHASSHRGRGTTILHDHRCTLDDGDRVPQLLDASPTASRMGRRYDTHYGTLRNPSGQEGSAGLPGRRSRLQGYVEVHGRVHGRRRGCDAIGFGAGDADGA